MSDQPAGKVCGNCKTTCRADANFCTHCASPFHNPEAFDRLARRKRTLNVGLTLMVASVLSVPLGLLTCGLTWYLTGTLFLAGFVVLIVAACM